MRAIVLAVAICALFAASFAVAQDAAVAEAPRFAAAEHEDAAVVAEQEAEFEATLAGEEEADEEGEGEEESDEAEEEETDEAEEESAEEAEEEAGEEETSEEGEEEADEETDEEADEDSSEEEADEESDAESEGNPDFVLAELKDNAVMTGFMEMVAAFVPTAARAAEHLVHSLSSEQAAAADQQYAAGYAHGHADGWTTAQTKPAASEEEESDEAETNEEGEAAFVEGASKASPVYTSQYYAGYPSAGVYYQPYHAIPAPPQLPSWLPPPPYIMPVAPKGKDGDDG
jgi:hypothetical protein